MNANKIRPANCKKLFGLFSPIVGTPANKLRPSLRDSAKTSNSAPISAKFRSKKWKSHRIEYAMVCWVRRMNGWKKKMHVEISNEKYKWQLLGNSQTVYEVWTILDLVAMRFGWYFQHLLELSYLFLRLNGKKEKQFNSSSWWKFHKKVPNRYANKLRIVLSSHFLKLFSSFLLICAERSENKMTTCCRHFNDLPEEQRWKRVNRKRYQLWIV